MAYSVAGKRVVIPGASPGTGPALARRPAGHGAVVGLIARRSERLAEVLADCRRTSADSTMWVADLAETAAVAVLDNNAAMRKRRPVAALAPAEVEDVMRVNFLAPMRLTLAVLPRMLERGHGVIVNVSSVGGRLGIIHEAAYCASKFALCGWSESLAVDLHGSGVVVKLIEPGPVDTEIWDQPGSEQPPYQGPKLAAEEEADGIIAALAGEGFEHYVPDVKAVVDAKNADLDAFIAGVVMLAPRLMLWFMASP